MATKSSDTPTDAKTADTPQRRAWSTPALVEYGHLAKLTRGSSGAVVEPGSYMMCL